MVSRVDTTQNDLSLIYTGTKPNWQIGSQIDANNQCLKIAEFHLHVDT